MNLKKITVVVFTILTLINYAQTKQGAILIVANSNFNFNHHIKKIEGNNFSRDAETTNNFIFLSKFAYALINNLFIGAHASYLYKVEIDKNFEFESKINGFTFTPFLKLYILKNKIKSFFTIKLDFGTQKSKFNIETNEFTTNKKNVKTFKTATELSYFFNKFINVDLSLNYLISTLGNYNEQENRNAVTYKVNSNVGLFKFL